MSAADMEALFGSSSDEEGEPQAAPAAEEAEPAAQEDQMAALFGSSDEEEEKPQHRTTQALGDDEDEPPPRSRSPSPQQPRGPPVRVEAELLDAPAQSSLRLVKLPNILGVEARPFDADTFDWGAEVEIDARGFKRVRLRDQNCIRWRWAADDEGNQVRESNARFVRWSDGSLQLLVGDEVLDVREIDTSGEHTYAYARLPNLIQGQGQLAAKLVFQPASLQSNLHRQMRAATEKLHVKSQKVRATATVVDPKKAKAEQERAEAERIRAREKLEEKQARALKKFSVPAYMRAPRAPQALSAGYLEEDEDLDEEGLAEDMQDAQRQRMMGGRRPALDEREEAAAAARLAAAKAGGGAGGKRRRIEEEEDDEEAISGEEEEEEEWREEEEEEGAEEMKDFIVDEDEEEGGSGGGGDAAGAAAAEGGRERQQQPAAKQRRQVVLSDSEED